MPETDDCLRSDAGAGAAEGPPQGFMSRYFLARARIEALGERLVNAEAIGLRAQRLELISRLVEDFGQVPSAELEAYFLRTAGRDLDGLLHAIRRYILVGVDDCRRLMGLEPHLRPHLETLAVRLESWGLFWQGNLLFAAERYGEAMSAYQRVLVQDPDFPRAESIYNSLGMAWEHAVGELPRAESMYTEVILRRRARLEELRREGKPLRHPRGLPVEGPPGDLHLTPVEALALALERRGELRMKLGAFLEAAGDFEEAAALRDGDPVTRRKARRARWRHWLRPLLGVPRT